MRAKLLAFIIITLFSLFFLNPTFAHETAETNTFTIQVHISPNDQPLALQLSRIQIEVIDKAKTFNFSNCNCLLKVEKFDTTLAEITVTGEGEKTEISYTFANEGDYTLKLSGSPKDATNHSFDPFELTFKYKVAPVPLNSDSQSQQSMLNDWDMSLQILSMIILSALVILSVVVYLKKRSHNLEKNKPQ